MQAPAFPGDVSPGVDGTATTVRGGERSDTAGDGVVPHRTTGDSASDRGLAVLARLRVATATAHARVEARLFPSALHDLSSYRRMLAVLLALHEPLEQHFATEKGFVRLGIDLVERRKVGGLRDDLACLDTQLGETALPLPSAATTPLPTLPTALGAFYVLEGSTLGGRFLLPEVRERLGNAPTGFLVGYGDRTGRLWKQTRTALVRGVIAARHPSDAEYALIAGADATFARLDALLDKAGWVAA